MCGRQCSVCELLKFSFIQIYKPGEGELAVHAYSVVCGVFIKRVRVYVGSVRAVGVFRAEPNDSINVQTQITRSTSPVREYE